MTERLKSSREPASTKEPIAFVIDDDASMRRALTNLFQSAGIGVEVFGSAPVMLKASFQMSPAASSWTSGCLD